VASRVEALAIAREPRLGAAIRAALTDYYFNSVRLVAANVVWGAAVAGVAVAWLVWPLAGLVLTPLLALPTVGVFRLAALIVREGHASFRDSVVAVRTHAGAALLIGIALLAIGLVLGTNAVVGLTQGEPLGWFIGTFAVWGLIVSWCGALIAWPLVVDPLRADDSLGRRLRLVGLLLVAYPIRFAVLGVAIALIAAVSALLLAALLTVSVSFIALVACRHVYPSADRLEARLAERA
jgi:hypothetical protein